MLLLVSAMLARWPLLLLFLSLVAAAAAPDELNSPSTAVPPSASSKGPGKWTLWGKRLPDDDDDDRSNSVLTRPSPTNSAWTAAASAARRRTAPPNAAPWWVSKLKRRERERERQEKKRRFQLRCVFFFEKKTQPSLLLFLPSSSKPLPQAHVASIASSPTAHVVFDEVSDMNGRVTVREAEFFGKEEEKEKEKEAPLASRASRPPPPPPPPRYRLLMFGDRHVQSVALMDEGSKRQMPGVLVPGYARAMAAAAVALCEAEEGEGEGGGKQLGKLSSSADETAAAAAAAARRRGLLAKDARLLVVGAGGGALPLALAEILSSASSSSSKPSSPSSSSSSSSLPFVEAVEIDPVVLRAASTLMGLPEAEKEDEEDLKDPGEAGRRQSKDKKAAAAAATPKSRKVWRERERARHRRHPPLLPRKLLMLPSAAVASSSSSSNPHLRVKLGDGFAAVARARASSLSAVFLDAFSGDGGEGFSKTSKPQQQQNLLDATSPTAFDDSFLLSASRALRPGGVLVANVMTAGGEGEKRRLVEKLVLRSERAFETLDSSSSSSSSSSSPSSFAFVALPPPSPLEEGNIIVAVVKARKQQQRVQRSGGKRIGWWSRSRSRSKEEQEQEQEHENRSEEKSEETLLPAPPTVSSAISAAKARAAVFKSKLPLDVEGLLGLGLDGGAGLRPAGEWLREAAASESLGSGLRSEL